jgi:hypothetical protein
VRADVEVLQVPRDDVAERDDVAVRGLGEAPRVSHPPPERLGVVPEALAREGFLRRLLRAQILRAPDARAVAPVPLLQPRRSRHAQDPVEVLQQSRALPELELRLEEGEVAE